MVNEQNLGDVVICTTISGAHHALGVMLSYCDSPTAGIDTSNNGFTDTHWRAELTRAATPMEATMFWKERAEAAERKLRDFKPPSAIPMAEPVSDEDIFVPISRYFTSASTPLMQVTVGGTEVGWIKEDRIAMLRFAVAREIEMLNKQSLG